MYGKFVFNGDWCKWLEGHISKYVGLVGEEKCVRGRLGRSVLVVVQQIEWKRLIYYRRERATGRFALVV